MLSFLFWNLNKKPLQARIARLVVKHGVDILMLAECVTDPSELLAALNGTGGLPYCCPASKAPKIRVLTRLPESDLRDQFNDAAGSLTIRELRLRNARSVLLAILHFPSKIDWDVHDQTGGAARLAHTIAQVEGKRWRERTILVGDFNMNPFDPGVVSAHALHGVMTVDVARRRSREVRMEEHPFFYNPMWGCFGDRTPGPPGSFYLGTSKPVNYFWNIYDQVLLRPGLVDALRDLAILDTDGSESLLTKAGLPQTSGGSDHLPLFFQLNL
ncbi:MAG TPA: endonuclease/exonuclease/phosphatase family protein [Gemmataceae bacterium]|nr:endonuclease/exonuclease/phosphatase family protein [Gemmataceae bacterium]